MAGKRVFSPAGACLLLLQSLHAENVGHALHSDPIRHRE
jgi:hypothetical protein